MIRYLVVFLIVTATACGQPESAPVVNTPPTQFGAQLERVHAFCDAPDDLVIKPIGPVTLRNTKGDWATLIYDAERIIDVQAETSGLKKNTRYFVYAYESANTVQYEIALDPPDNQLQFKLGDEHYAFITTFYTDSSGPHVIRFSQANREYQYTTLAEDTDASDNKVLNKGVARKRTTVYVNDSAWEGLSKLVYLKVKLSGGSAGGQLFAGSRNYWSPSLALSANAYGTATGSISLVYPNTRAFDYELDANANNADVWVTGFSF